MSFLTILRSYLFAAVFYVTTALFLLLGSWLFFAPRSWAIAGLKVHGATCTWLLGLITGTKMEVRGSDLLPEGACLVVSKHQSAWDTFALIPLFADPAVVLKDELKWIPFYGWFCVKFAHILVKRDKAGAALKSMIREAKDRVAARRQILIFPEGTRREPGAAPDYKPGYLALYEALDVPCVPLALNSGLYWPRRSLIRHPGTIIVQFLEPIPPGLSRKDFRVALESRLEAACDRLLLEAASSEAPPPLSATVDARISDLNKEET